jgi:hypothetical protein
VNNYRIYVTWSLDFQCFDENSVELNQQRLSPGSRTTWPYETEGGKPDIDSNTRTRSDESSTRSPDS